MRRLALADAELLSAAAACIHGFLLPLLLLLLLRLLRRLRNMQLQLADADRAERRYIMKGLHMTPVIGSGDPEQDDTDPRPILALFTRSPGLDGSSGSCFVATPLTS
jgi:hypothetical protein